MEWSDGTGAPDTRGRPGRVRVPAECESAVRARLTPQTADWSERRILRSVALVHSAGLTGHGVRVPRGADPSPARPCSPGPPARWPASPSGRAPAPPRRPPRRCPVCGASARRPGQGAGDPRFRPLRFEHCRWSLLRFCLVLGPCGHAAAVVTFCRLCPPTALPLGPRRCPGLPPEFPPAYEGG